MRVIEYIELCPSECSKYLNPALVELVRGIEGYGKEHELPVSLSRKPHRKDLVVIAVDLSLGRSGPRGKREEASEERRRSEFILLDAKIGGLSENPHGIRWIMRSTEDGAFQKITDLLCDLRKGRGDLEPQIYLIKSCAAHDNHKIAAVSNPSDVFTALKELEIEELSFLEEQKDIHLENLRVLYSAA